MSRAMVFGAVTLSLLAACNSGGKGGDSRIFETLGGTVTLDLPSGYPTDKLNLQLTDGVESKTFSISILFDSAAGAYESGAFEFPTALQTGSTYTVDFQKDLESNPIHPHGLDCRLENASGAIDTSSRTAVQVHCTSKNYPVFVNETGMYFDVGGVQLQNVSGNASDTLMVTKTALQDEKRKFQRELPHNAEYNVTVLGQSMWECALAGSTGRVAGPVNTTSLSCALPKVALFAGVAGGGDSGRYRDAIEPLQARFDWPSGVAVDGAGNVYVADEINHLIRKITPAGVVSTLAGLPGISGFANGTGSAARFNSPHGIAVDSAGNVYVADTGNQAIRKITPAGVVSTFTLAGSSANGSGSAGIAVDANDNLYVTGSGAILKISPAGVVSTLAGSAGLSVAGIAVDAGGNLYTASNPIRKITPAGVVTTLAADSQSGSTDNTCFWTRFGIAVDAGGNLYVADTYNNVICKITPAGDVTTLAGGGQYEYGSANGAGSAARFHFPYGIAADASGNLYVADKLNDLIRRITPAGIVSTVAGSPRVSVIDDSADGIGSAARFKSPSGIALDRAGNAYVADRYNNLIRKITPAGIVSTLAGSPGQEGSADGTGSAARFFYPTGIAVDVAGNAYVADQNTHLIRKITPAGVVSTLAGVPDGSSGFANGTGSAARFSYPSGIAVDGVGTVYVADMVNCVIRKITPGGVVSTLAGSPGVADFADGTGSTARFYLPSGIAVDSAGNVYVADQNNHLIRKITPAGVVSTLAGSPGLPGSADGTGSAARFSSPSGIAVDSTGNVYVADQNNHLIRKITTDGMVKTVLGETASDSFETGRLPGKLGSVDGIAISAPDSDGDWNLFFTSGDAVGGIFKANVYLN